LDNTHDNGCNNGHSWTSSLAVVTFETKSFQYWAILVAVVTMAAKMVTAGQIVLQWSHSRQKVFNTGQYVCMIVTADN